MQQFIPMRLTSLWEPFNHPDWIFEVKYDGFRALAHIDRSDCRLVSRNLNTYKSYSDLAAAVGAELRVQTAVLNRELDEVALFGPDYKDNPLVFCRLAGGYCRPDQMSSRVDLAVRAGLPDVGMHSFRHSHASQLLSRGAPVPSVAKRLAHANPNITLSIYSHALEA